MGRLKSGASTSSIVEGKHTHVLRVIVHSANHLLPKDLNGSSDPFAKIFCDDVEYGRSPTRKGDLNPVFNYGKPKAARRLAAVRRPARPHRPFPATPHGGVGS